MQNLAFLRSLSRIFRSPSNLSSLRSRFNGLVFAGDQFWWRLSHFIAISAFGFLALKFTNSRTTSPNALDLLFTSVSATTVSSMSAVEMEVFSNTQLIIITVLMFLGGEVFVSMLGFQLSRLFVKSENTTAVSRSATSGVLDELETGTAAREITPRSHVDDLRSKSLRSLGNVIMGYLLGVIISGSCLVSFFITLVPHAKHVLENKGLKLSTFSLFTTVSTFTNCGFIPTNENMMVFKNNSGLLLLLTSQVLLGGCLYSPCLRFTIWVMKKVTRREEFEYMLKNFSEMGYPHLFSGGRSGFMAGTAVGFIVLQLILFCSSEWKSEGLWDGLNPYRKFAAALFQVTNSRHAGETVVDLSVISPAILVVFVIMMYLPPQTTFLPTGYGEIASSANEKNGKCKKEPLIMQFVSLSQLSYLAIFIILICITEKHKLKEDPLNFNVLNIIIEVISAYGNVGFSTGYSCKRQLKPDSSCQDAWYGFSGRWSGKGKFILIIVMFFGRLKSFNGGRAWKLS